MKLTNLVFVSLIGLSSIAYADLERSCPGIPDTVVAIMQCAPLKGRAENIVIQITERVGCSTNERFALIYQNSSALINAELGRFEGSRSTFFRAYKGVEEYIHLSGSKLREARFSSAAPGNAAQSRLSLRPSGGRKADIY